MIPRKLQNNDDLAHSIKEFYYFKVQRIATVVNFIPITSSYSTIHLS